MRPPGERSAAVPPVVGVVRLERLTREGHRLTSRSSVIGWFRAMQGVGARLALVVPVERSSGDADGGGRQWLELRPSDRLLSLPDAAGFLRLALVAPLVAWRLVQLRRVTAVVVCRVPEHGSALVLPLVRLLGFRPVLWLVADRDEVRAATIGRRGRTLRVRVADRLSAVLGRLERRALRRWPVIANGSVLADRVRALRPGRADVLQIVSSTMSAADMPAERPTRAARSGPVELLYVGRVAPDKGLGDLLAALERCVASLGADGPQLTIVGWAAHGEGERLTAEIAARGLAERVRFVGPQGPGEELYRHFRRADVFVLPSHSEGTPRVLVEAMAFGLPIVATTVGGIPDLVVPHEHGLLVPPGEPAALAEAITTLARDVAARERMSVRNHATAREHSVERLAARMLAFVAAASDRRGG